MQYFFACRVKKTFRETVSFLLPLTTHGWRQVVVTGKTSSAPVVTLHAALLRGAPSLSPIFQ